MKSHTIPTRTWSKISADLFQLNGNDFLVMLDHYSDYIELDTLSGNTMANLMIKAMKRQSARHGIPHKLITDNSLQFESYEYLTFAQEYGFTIVKSSPYYSRENGKAESEVKIAKEILNKYRKEDPYLAILAYRNTPQHGYNYSPAQRLMSRRRASFASYRWSSAWTLLSCIVLLEIALLTSERTLFSFSQS